MLKQQTSYEQLKADARDVFQMVGWLFALLFLWLLPVLLSLSVVWFLTFGLTDMILFFFPDTAIK